jgi:hypothetical protein
MRQMSDSKNKAYIEREVMRAVARLKAGILGLVFGLIFGVGLFAMTAILLIESGPNTGYHLRLLGNYFIGYTVTWKGAFIGFLWAFATGALIGWSIGIIYNRIVKIRTNSQKK